MAVRLFLVAEATTTRQEEARPDNGADDEEAPAPELAVLTELRDELRARPR